MFIIPEIETTEIRPHYATHYGLPSWNLESNLLITIAQMTFEMKGIIFVEFFFFFFFFFSSVNLSAIQVLKKHLETTNYDKGTRPNHGGANSVAINSDTL